MSWGVSFPRSRPWLQLQVKAKAAWRRQGEEVRFAADLLIVFAMIRSTVALSRSDIPFSSFQCANIKPHPSVADRALAAFGKPPYLREMMLDLSDEETDALAKLLRQDY
jgi:hypothetical protein